MNTKTRTAIWVAVATAIFAALILWWTRDEGIEQALSPSPETPSREISAEKKGNSLPKLSAQEKMRIERLAVILQARNDNDPRLDSEFRNLSRTMKDSMVELYKKTPLEDRNARGTIVFLIARQANDAQDFAFLRSVLTEPRCLSLKDCAQPSHDTSHLSGVNSLTLVYPQMAALYQLDQKITPNLEPELRKEIVATLETAKQNSSSLVRNKASEFILKLKKSEQL